MPMDQLCVYKFLLRLPLRVVLDCVELTSKPNHHSEFEVSLEYLRACLKQINKTTNKLKTPKNKH